MTRESGEGKFGVIVFIGVIAIIIFAALKYVPPRLNAYEFKEFVEQTALQAPYDNKANPESIKKKLVERAEELKIPIEPEEISVIKSGEACNISVIIKIPVDFAVYKYTLVVDCTTNSRAAT